VINAGNFWAIGRLGERGCQKEKGKASCLSHKFQFLYELGVHSAAAAVKSFFSLYQHSHPAKATDSFATIFPRSSFPT